MKIRCFTLIHILILVSFNISAEETKAEVSKWYVGGIVGHGSVDIKSSSHTNNQDNVTTFGASGGYNFSERFSLEITLFSTGELADNQANLTSAYLSALTVAPKFSYKVSDLYSLTAKAGIAYMIYDEEYDNYILYQRNYDQSWTGSAAIIGLGAEFSFSSGMSVSINYDRMIGDLEAVEESYYSYAQDIDIDLEQLSISLHYHF